MTVTIEPTNSPEYANIVLRINNRIRRIITVPWPEAKARKAKLLTEFCYWH